MRKKLAYQLYLYYLSLIVLAVVAVIWFSSHSLRDFYYNRTRADLIKRALILQSRTEDLFRQNRIALLSEVLRNLSRDISTRITLVDRNGVVLMDSEEDPAGMENHGGRPEIRKACQGEMGDSVRYSSTIETEMMYVAVPVRGEGGSVDAVLRVSVPLTLIDKTLYSINRKILVGGLIIALIGGILSIVLSRKFSYPIEELKQKAFQIAEGRFEGRIRHYGTEEIDDLVDSMNLMAGEIQNRITEITEKNTEQGAILSSMVEGVIAVDADEKIISVNRAAEKLLKIRKDNSGRLFRELVRNTEIQQFVTSLLEKKEVEEREFLICEMDREYHIRGIGTPLMDINGKRCIGALLVLNDVTKLVKLERMRRDFVANVSHELKTPLTAIKGSVETIMGGGAKKKDTERFLEIIHKHTERLSAIIEDILSLASVEDQEQESGEDRYEKTDIRPIIENACEICRRRALEKDISISVDCGKGLDARVNSLLLEQALVNLVDNALKYTEIGGRVEVSAKKKDDRVSISVTDDGCGIPSDHLPRIFERFYRVDKARSRRLGGTGLGLAIVKHIVTLHKGEVGVESEQGHGSTFTMSIPV